MGSAASLFHRAVMVLPCCCKSKERGHTVSFPRAAWGCNLGLEDLGSTPLLCFQVWEQVTFD